MDTSEPVPASVRERLKAYKESVAGLQTTTLPASNIAVTFPGFVTHDKVMAAAKIAGKNRNKTGMIIVAQVCLFEGERLTVDEVGTLLCNQDVTHLINLVLGDDEDEADEGGGGN